jgi:DtxR family Mn-dependent transcriptional regulator
MLKTEPITQNIQDYLKQIYALTETGQAAATTDLAARLGIAPASVTGMLQRLAALEPALVVYRKHQGVTLTLAGQRAALEVIRHHRLLETYLVTILGYSWDNVHEEACKLEHFISEEFERRIAAALGNPTHDPHGEPIPSPDLIMPTDESRSLAALRPPQQTTIMRVKANDPALLRHLESLGLMPGARLVVLDYSAFDQNLTLQVENREPRVIGLAISRQIFVSAPLNSSSS